MSNIRYIIKIHRLVLECIFAKKLITYYKNVHIQNRFTFYKQIKILY